MSFKRVRKFNLLSSQVKNFSRLVSQKKLKVYFNYIIKKVIKVDKLYIRSPLTCKLNTGLCQICYGWNLGNGRMVELGETVGIIAAQSIGEPGTQLTMRTFHTGGIFSSEVAQTILSPIEGTLHYNSKNNGKKIINKYKEKIFFTYQNKNLIIKKNNLKKYKINLPPNTIIFAKPNQKVTNKQIIAQITDWSKKKSTKKTKEMKEIKTNISGQIFFELRNKKKTLSLNTEDLKAIWVLSSNILNLKKINKNLLEEKTKYRNTQQKKENQTYKIKLKKRNFWKIKLLKKRKTIKLNYTIQKLIKESEEVLIKKNKTEQILTKINESKFCGSFIDFKEKIKENTKNKFTCQIIQQRKSLSIIRKSNPYTVPKEGYIIVKNLTAIKKNNNIIYNSFKKQKNEDIVQGLPKIEELLEAKRTTNFKIIEDNLHDKLKKVFYFYNKTNNNKLAARKSISKIQSILVNKIQKVYLSQGVRISDKHLEIIVKQMTSRIIITDGGKSNFLAGEIMELNKVEKLNATNKILYEPILMGISKLALNNESFISEACFQETTKVLAKSAVKGKIDWLYGLKENLILGNLIPAGTGFKS